LTSLFDYQVRRQTSELRRMLRGARRRLTPQSPIGSASAPENAGMLAARGQIMEIYDVLQADGTVEFSFGTTGMTDDTWVP